MMHADGKDRRMINLIEILEKFGIETNIAHREDMFRTKIANYAFAIAGSDITDEVVWHICQKMSFPMSTIPCEKAGKFFVGTFLREILFSRFNAVDFHTFLARLGILLQHRFFIEKTILIDLVKEELEECKLPYEICNGIIIPKGVKEFDKALVCDVVEWLTDYQSTHKLYMTALQQYSENDEPSIIADSLRKSFEAFLREFLGNKKNLDNNKNEVCLYLKNHNVNEEMRNMFATLISYYKTLNDKTAKHHDATDKNSVEFLLYQTGVFMRYLLVIKRVDEQAQEENAL